MAKNNQQFADFLRDEVNLNQSRLDRLETAVGGVNDYLKNNLPGYQKMEKQGSYALGTLIKPVDDSDEYDADIQIVMNPNSKWEPRDYINQVNRTLSGNKTYADKLRLKTRCVTVDYAGDFHLDVVPRVTSEGKHYVCNRIENRREPTDGNGYRDWFNDKNRISGGNLKRVVRLLKHLRDHKNSFRAKSILLTTLAGNTIRTSDEGTEGVSTVADTLETVLSRMNDYLQRHPNMPEIKNPVLPAENFNRHWTQQNYTNFRNRIQTYARIARQAKAELTTEKAIKLWQELFGESFGKSSGSGGGSGQSNGGAGGTRPQESSTQGARNAAAPSFGYSGSPKQAAQRGRRVRIRFMTDDHFHPESLEEFKGQLTAEGFEPVVPSDVVRWRGPIHSAFSSLSEATTMSIVIRAGWPFQPPVLLVEGLDTNHSTLGGYVCMWRDGDPSLEWTTVTGFSSRIEAWCEKARNGWPGDELGYDAFLNFREKHSNVVTFDLPKLGIRIGGWGECHGVVNAEPFRVDVKPGRQKQAQQLRGLWFHAGALESPPPPPAIGGISLPVREATEGVTARPARPPQT